MADRQVEVAFDAGVAVMTQWWGSDAAGTADRRSGPRASTWARDRQSAAPRAGAGDATLAGWLVLVTAPAPLVGSEGMRGTYQQSGSEHRPGDGPTRGSR